MDRSIQDKAFLLLLALVTVAFVWLLLPFYGAVFWAVILAIIFRPLQRVLERWLGRRRNLAALVSLLVCVLIAIIPLTVIVGALISEGTALVARLQSGETGLPAGLPVSVDAVYANLPDWASEALGRVGAGDLEALRARLTSALVATGRFIAERALDVGTNTLRFFASLGIMLYVLFFLFRDGPAIGRNIRASMPLSEPYSRRLLDVFAAVVRATVKGNIVIAVLQGTIGGVTFWLLGVEAALLWGVLMTFLSIVPAVGAGLVWAPMAAVFLLGGDYVRGGLLLLVGAGVISLVDNLLRPTLVGRDTRLPDYVVLVSTVGGLSLFGINGFIIGPLIAALFVAGWTVFRDDWSGRDAPAPR